MSSMFLVRTVGYLATFVALLFFERYFPFADSGQKKSFRVSFHLGISIANSIALYAIMTWPITAALSHTETNQIGLRHFFGLTGAAGILATVVVFDMWDYWMHLANHRIGFLWRFHRAHHSDMEIDVTTAARFHIGELIISTCIKCLIILFWGPSLAGLIIFDILLNGASQFHHGNLNIPFRLQDVIEKFIVTPRMHRCHHSLHQDCFNHNFSTIFSFWDRLFRSYHWARETREMEQIGLSMPRGPETMRLRQFLMAPFRNY
jgi:sterol desaturase/sphingolipid hydroxylase (fatty acid hydroxylase superfamily)